MNECEYYLRCKNNDKCYRCFNEKLLELPEDKAYKKNNNKFNYKTANSKNSWEDLEQQVANKLNKVPNIKEARRSLASGALDFEKGDIVDSILHPECKERTGRVLKTGEKTISLKKEWLEKAQHEAEMNDKTMCLPFRFKGDDTIYSIINFDKLAELVCNLKSFIKDNEIKTKEIEELKKIINNR